MSVLSRHTSSRWRAATRATKQRDKPYLRPKIPTGRNADRQFRLKRKMAALIGRIVGRITRAGEFLTGPAPVRTVPLDVLSGRPMTNVAKEAFERRFIKKRNTELLRQFGRKRR